MMGDSLYMFTTSSCESYNIATRVLSVLEPWITTPPRSFTFGWHGVGGTEVHSGSIRELGKVQDEIIKGHAGCIRVETDLDMRFPFGCAELAFHYIKLESQQFVSIDIATIELLRTPKGVFLRDNWDALCTMGGEIFVAGGFFAGLLADEEARTALELENCAADPPVDYCYWSGEVLRYVTRAHVEEVDSKVAECRKLEGGSRYWRWDDYEQECPRYASEKLALKAALQSALKKYLASIHAVADE